MQCAKMQGSTKAVIVLDPSTSHFANALQFNASTSPAQILLISGESSIKETRQEDRRKKSSWIRRLKSQEELELSNGGTAEASLEMTYSERGNSCERMDLGSGSMQPGWFLQGMAENGARARPNWQAECVSDAKRQKMSEQKDCNGGRRSDICQEKTTMIESGKSMTSSAVALPSNVGFGPWVNFSAGRKPDNTVTTSTQEPSKDIQGNFRSAFSLTNSRPRCRPVSMVGDVTAPAIFYKPPLSPVNSKLGLPPRPSSKISHPASQVAPSASGLGQGGFHQFSQDDQSSRQLFETPSNRESKQSVRVQGKGTSELADAAVGRSESSFQILKPSEQSFSDSMRDHGNGLSDCGQQLFARMGKDNPPIRQARSSVADRTSAYIAIGQPLGSCSDGKISHPASQVAPSASGLGQGVFHQFAQDVQSSRQLFETPSYRESKQPVRVQGKDTSEPADAAVGRSESSFQILKPAEQSFSDSMRDHGNGLSDCGQQLFARMGNDHPPIRQATPSVAERASAYIAIAQPLGTCSDGGAVQFENGRRGVRELNMSREGVRGPICTSLPSDGMDLHLKVSVLGMEDPKPALKNGSASLEPNKTSMQESPSGSSYGTTTSEKADASASTSASLPWEMFIESAGASKKAREQFVEVYNRARDELKNQRMSQRMSRALAKEMGGGPKLTLGPGDTTSDHSLKRQLLKRDQHLAGLSHSQGRLNFPSTNAEHGTLSRASSKVQHSISLVESKGPLTTLANDQSGLQRENGVLSKSDTPWKQAEDYRLEQILPQRQSRSSVKVQECDEQIACQRLEVVHIKEGMPADKCQNVSSTSAAHTRELASKLHDGNGLGQIARLSHQLDDALGKRPHVTFEEHSISRVTEKDAVSQARPQSKPHVWLQRWHPNAVYNSKGLPDAQVPSEGKNYLALGLKKFKDGDGVGVFGRSREYKNVSVDKETGVKTLKTSPSKVLPSAAAMAIVGTAARQFCSAQPQHKGSFAFWSGFGMPPPRKLEPVQEEGKTKMFSKADVNMPNC